MNNYVTCKSFYLYVALSSIVLLLPFGCVENRSKAIVDFRISQTSLERVLKEIDIDINRSQTSLETLNNKYELSHILIYEFNRMDSEIKRIEDKFSEAEISLNNLENRVVEKDTNLQELSEMQNKLMLFVEDIDKDLYALKRNYSDICSKYADYYFTYTNDALNNLKMIHEQIKGEIKLLRVTPVLLDRLKIVDKVASDINEAESKLKIILEERGLVNDFSKNELMYDILLTSNRIVVLNENLNVMVTQHDNIKNEAATMRSQVYSDMYEKDQKLTKLTKEKDILEEENINELKKSVKILEVRLSELKPVFSSLSGEITKANSVISRYKPGSTKLETLENIYTELTSVKKSMDDQVLFYDREIRKIKYDRDLLDEKTEKTPSQKMTSIRNSLREILVSIDMMEKNMLALKDMIPDIEKNISLLGKDLDRWEHRFVKTPNFFIEKSLHHEVDYKKAFAECRKFGMVIPPVEALKIAFEEKGLQLSDTGEWGQAVNHEEAYIVRVRDKNAEVMIDYQKISLVYRCAKRTNK